MLRYLWNKLESMSSLEQECYIYNVFERFNITPIFPIKDNFYDTPGKQSNHKNPLGYLVMHLTEEQLIKLLPDYLVDLMELTALGYNDHKLFSLTHKLLHSTAVYIDYNKEDMFDVFNFGVGKYSPWSFLKLDDMKLIPAFFRHMYKDTYISKIDEETGLPHKAHAACNVRMIELIRRNK